MHVHEYAFSSLSHAHEREVATQLERRRVALERLEESRTAHPVEARAPRDRATSGWFRALRHHAG